MPCTTVVSVLLALALVSSVGALLPCDSPWRLTFPSLFTHCGDCEGTYSEWNEWEGDTTVSVSSSQCESGKALQQTRNRYSLQDGCDLVESETQHICMPTQAETLIDQLLLGNTGPSQPEGTEVLVLTIAEKPHYVLNISNSQPILQQRKRKEIVPPSGHGLNTLIQIEQQRGCLINDDDTCSGPPYTKKRRSIANTGHRVPSLQSRSRPSHGHTIADEQVVLDKAPIPFDWNQHHMRYRRSHRGCNTGARHVLFVLDTSGSIGLPNFKKMKEAVSNLTRLFCGEPKIAVLTFGAALHIDFCFNCITNKVLAADAIKYIRYRSGGYTRTGSAAQCVCDRMLTEACGLPSDASCIDVIFITDGQSNRGPDICQAVRCIHDYANVNGKRIVTHAIGIGNVDKNELNCIHNNNELTHLHPYFTASDNESIHVYTDFEDFAAGVRAIEAKLIEMVMNQQPTCMHGKLNIVHRT